MHYRAHLKIRKAENLACHLLGGLLDPADLLLFKNNTPKHTFVSRLLGGGTGILGLTMDQRRTVMDTSRRSGIVTGILFIAATAAGAL